MGLVFWLYDRSLEPTLRYIDTKFGKRPEVAQANTAALKAGYHYGETVEAINTQYHVAPAKLAAGTYRNIIGNQALAWGLLAAAQMSEKQLFLGPTRSRLLAIFCMNSPSTRISMCSRFRPKTKSQQ